MLMDGWTGSLLCLPCLDAGFLIRTDDPGPLFEQSGGMFIQVQDWAGTLEEWFWILNMLPRMEPPGTNLFVCQPAANGAG